MVEKDVKAMAKENEWAEIESRDPYMVSFSKVINDYPARINVWFGKKGITVGTCLNHPKHGKGSLYRKHVNKTLMKKIFKNPRVHTAHGYGRA